MMKRSHCTEVKYLFQNDKPYDIDYDLGRNLLQCARSVSSKEYFLLLDLRAAKVFVKPLSTFVLHKYLELVLLIVGYHICK